MGKCRIQNIVPPCGYRVDGIDLIRLLDFDDFNGFKFDDGDLYNNCLVTAVLRSGDFVEVDTPDSAKYTSSLQNGIYTHSLDTFIGDLSAELEAMLHLATKRRYIVLFRAKNGRYFAFAYEAGATVSYTGQTSDGMGSLLTITASSIYPLFECYEVSVEWRDFINAWVWVEPDVQSEWADFINVWEESCYNDFNIDFNVDFNCDAPTGPFVYVDVKQVWFTPEPEGFEQVGVQSNTDWEIT